MLKITKLITIAAAAALAVPALAGSWPPTPAPKSGEKAAATARLAPAKTAAQPRATNGFEYVGGEAGWQLAQHKYVFAGGRLAHSDECDHAIRAAQAAPTARDVDSMRMMSPGA